MRIAIVMDALEKIKPYKDTTLAMIRACDAKSVSCVICTPSDIYCTDGTAYARVYSLTISDENSPNWAKTKALGEHALSDFDIILMRKDPPFDMEYIYTTYALELAEKAGVLVANRPQSLRDANEKFFTLHFPNCCPPTLVCSQIDQLKAFWQQHKKVIYKPLEGMGGKSVFLVDESGANLSVVLETLTDSQRKFIMAQAYIPEITQLGDKRILMVHGKPVPFALARIPAPGENRGNLAAGATGKVVPLTARDQWICDQVGPSLINKGLYFVGLDVIGDYLTEINVTSPTCLREIEKETGLAIASDYIQGLIDIVRT